MGKKIIEFDSKKYNNEVSLEDRIKSDDLLDMAYEASSKSQAIKYAKQSLKLNPNNIDSQSLIADFEENDIKKLKKYEAIIKTATEILEKEDMFKDENIGSFWGLIGTRPYMRIRHRKVLTLMSLGRYTEAVKECEELLRLCENDNMGIRYILIGLYCILERFVECEKLFKKYGDYSLHMVFVMAIMYFKKGDYKKCKEFLKLSEEQNEYIFDFLLAQNGELLQQFESGVDYYSQGSEEEAYLVINGVIYLLASIPDFLWFVVDVYNKGDNL